ncbi:hypothetical protein [Parahaliea aestuarii]
MTRIPIKAILWGIAVALFLRFGLEPTGWLFYQASFALNVDALYLGYQGFRGGYYLLQQGALLTPVSIVAGMVVALLVQWRLSRKEKS